MSADGVISEAVGKAEADLAAFWATATDDRGVTKARAATMNFVAVCAPSEVELLRRSIDDLAETRAGRVFLATIDGRLAPWELQAEVSAMCKASGEPVVCYDRVELRFGSMAASRAASVLSALSLSEVPTIVEIARGAPALLADAFVKAADRVIVDTATMGVARIAELAKKTRAPIADRAFVRAFSWRELVARFFDDAPGAERAIGRIEIERTRTERGDPAALLLGWLGARLGWRFESATRAVDAQGMAVRVAVHTPGDPHLGPGEIAAVRLVTAVDNRPLFCACERKPGERVACWLMEGPRTASHEHPLGFRDEGWVLLKAIDSTEGDRIYRDAVLAGAAWAACDEAGRA